MGKKFLISIPTDFSLEKEVEAESEEEARKKAEELEVTEFDNFDSFYEFLGDEFRHLVSGMEVEEL